MNKSKFLELVKNPELIDEKDLTKLKELTSEYPFSQLLHVLSVKAHKVNQNPNFDKSLNLAATYIYDRSVLYGILQGSGNDLALPPLETEEPVTQDSIFKDPANQEEVSDFEWVQEDGDEGGQFFSSDPTDTNPPKTQEAQQDTVEEKPQAPSSEDVKQPEINDLRESEVEAVPNQASLTDKELSLEAEKEQAPGIEKEEAPKAEEAESPKKETPQAKKKKSRKKESGPTEESEHQEVKDIPEEGGSASLDVEIKAESIHAELMQNLSQLQESKQQYEETPKNGDPQTKNEQIEIIDNFIKNSPVLSKPNLSADSEGVSQDDLSKNSTKFNVEFASENLAKIYLKQGKRKDAEKIYKKLMRKFPKKKAYFADQIEKLKKK